MKNVKKYGAVGDNVTDDTAAIQAAVDDLTSDGGDIYLPPGDYKITAPITIQKGTTIRGSGPLGTKISNYGDDDAIYAYTPAFGVAQLTITDLRILNRITPKTDRTKGAGIHIDTDGGYYVNYMIQNVDIYSHYECIKVKNTVSAFIQNVKLVTPLTDGFLSVGTCNALSLNSVYAVHPGVHGFNINGTGLYYSTLNNCACDLAGFISTGDAYHFTADTDATLGATGLTLTGCGAEGASGRSFYSLNSMNANLIGCFFLTSMGDAVHLRGGIDQSIIGVNATRDGTAPGGTYDLNLPTSTKCECSNVGMITSYFGTWPISGDPAEINDPESALTILL